MISKNYEIPGNLPQRGLVQFETELDFYSVFHFEKTQVKIIIK